MKPEKFLCAAIVLITVEIVAASLASAQQTAARSMSGPHDVESGPPVRPFRLASPVNVAYQDTRSILLGNNSCSRFYGGPHAEEVLTRFVTRLEVGMLRDSRTGIEMSGVFTYATQSEAGIEYRQFARAVINTRGPFLKAKVFPAEPLVPPFGGFRPNTREVRVLVLLHELAHLIKGKDGRWLIPDDGHAPELSAENTALVASHCRQQIVSLTSR